jgi:hypothetical protein
MGILNEIYEKRKKSHLTLKKGDVFYYEKEMPLTIMHTVEKIIAENESYEIGSLPLEHLIFINGRCGFKIKCTDGLFRQVSQNIRKKI